jgi:hypothetical protein
MSTILIIVLIIVLIIMLIFLNRKKEHFQNNYVKILWMYWEQGEHNIKDTYNKMCIDGWRRLNPDWDIRVLDKKSAQKYIPKIKKYGYLTIQQRSDLLRTKLLLKYGGVWADASTLPLKPLTGNIENIDNNTGVFFYRFIPESQGRICSSWFIISKKPNNYIISEISKNFENKIKIGKKYPYYFFHHCITELFKKDKKFREIFSKLTETQSLPHAPIYGKKYPDLVPGNIDKLPLLFKRAKKIKKEQYYKYLDGIKNKFID